MKIFTAALIASVIAAAGATSASAAVTGYDDATASTAAAGSLSTENFNDPSKFGRFGSVPVVFTGFSLSRTAPEIEPGFNDVGVPFGDLFNINGTGQVFAALNPVITVSLRFNAPIAAFGATFAGFNNVGQGRIIIGGRAIDPGPSTIQGVRFFGFVSDTSFDTLDFKLKGPDVQNLDLFSFDDALFANAIAPGVPEPASWVMLITGFGAIGAALRRRRVAVA